MALVRRGLEATDLGCVRPSCPSVKQDRARPESSEVGLSGASLVALKGATSRLTHTCGSMHSPHVEPHTHPLTLVSDPSSAASLCAGVFAPPPGVALAP